MYRRICIYLHVCTVHQQYQDTILLLQTDAHNYKIIGILKKIKIPTIGAIVGILIVLIFL